MDKDFEKFGYDNVYKGIKKHLKETKRGHLNMDNFNDYFKDYKIYEKSKTGKLDEHVDYILNHLNKKEVIIFRVDDEVLEKADLKVIDKTNLIFPYHSFFVEKTIQLPIDEEREIYCISGFLVQTFEEDILIHYLWSKTVKMGFAPNFFQIGRRVFNRGDYENLKRIHTTDTKTSLPDNVQKEIEIEIVNTIAKILFLIEKKEYSTYKKYTQNGYETKHIIYANDVKAHKRHFWEDTGYFTIPKLSKEEILARGYGMDELVCKDGELRQNVPYKLIGSFLTGEDKNRKKENRRIDLINKRHFRQEDKINKILHVLFPFELIRRRSRTVLKGLELDFNIPTFRLAVEYDGEQHFDKEICENVFKSNFEELQKRDKKKDKLCKKKNITLIRIRFDEKISLLSIRSKIKKVRPDIDFSKV